ncbi:hypothetical protein [Candidatus Rhodoblastus alkanivorans]|uniref:hypothetical protein n=1 Tax=Candidatus Rhodoblastus alkanivorans TaxID=2954117 RepID=UPI003CC891FB
MTTKKFLEVFGLGTLRDLPDIERMEEEGLLQRPQADIELDGALGLADDEGVFLDADDSEVDEAESEGAVDEA